MTSSTPEMQIQVPIDEVVWQVAAAANAELVGKWAEAAAAKNDDLPYLTYMSFGMYVVTLAGHLSAFVLMSYLMFCAHFRRQRLRVNGFSASISVYFWVNILCAASALSFEVYYVFSWYPHKHDYDKVFMYWSGSFLLNYITTSPVPVFFLTVDRCVAIKYGLSCYERNRRRLVAASVVVSLSVYAASSAIILAELPLRLEKMRGCLAFACTLTRFKANPQVIAKFTFGSVNLALSLYFFYLIRRYSVKMNIISGQSSVRSVGPNIAMFQGVEAAVCALIYARIFLRFERHAGARGRIAITGGGGNYTTHSLSMPTVPPNSVTNGFKSNNNSNFAHFFTKHANNI